MSKSPLYVHLLLDRSGSMEECRDQTIDAVNEYVHGLKVSEDVDARLSLTIFDTESIDVIHHAAPVSDIPKLTRATYVPRSGTPLLDAVGKAVSQIDGVKLREDEKVSLVIITDGQENSSHEYKLPAVRALLEGRQKDKGWLIVFLGADLDAFAEGGAIGVRAGMALSHSKGAYKEAFAATVRSQAAYARSGNLKDAEFTAEERARAGKKKRAH